MSDEDLDLPFEHYITYDLNENTDELITVYSRLSSNFPEHKEFNYWRIRYNYWVSYKNNIQNLAIDSIEKVRKEIDRTYSERLLMRETETNLLKERDKIY